MRWIRAIISPEVGAEIKTTAIALVYLFGIAIVLWFSAGAPLISVGPVSFGVPTATATPTPEALRCRFVQVPGHAVGADLCAMPGGMICLFDRGSEPTICYSEASKQ